MKFRCERDALVEALATAGRAASTRGGALPVLAGVRLELSGDELVFTGTDLDLTISVSAVVAGQSDGEAVVPARLMSDVTRALEPGAVEVDVTDNEARITAGRSEFSLRTIPPEEFPQVVVAAGDAVTIEASMFAGALRQVVRAASGDDSRPILTGVLMAAEDDGLRLVATDSYRLSIRDLPGTTVLGAGQVVLVPSRALDELARLLPEDGEITLRLGERDATFDVDRVQLTTRLIEGEFPKYQGLIPDEPSKLLTVGRLAFLEALRRVRLMAQDSTPVRLEMSSAGLELLAMTQDVGQAHESVDATYEGEDLTIAFNPEYLMDGIEVSSGDEITLAAEDSRKPALLRVPGQPEFLYLLMPVRVS